MTRKISILTTLTKAAKQGVMLEAVLPDGTIIRPATEAKEPLPTKPENPWDSLSNGNA